MEFENYTHSGIESEIREFFDSEFEGIGKHIEYVNPAFKIDSFYETSQKMRDLSKDLMIVTDYCEKNKISEDKYTDMAQNADSIEGFPMKKTGYFWGYEPIDLQKTKSELEAAKSKMEEYAS